MNLITSCVDCNLGKGDRPLDDDAVVVKQMNQMEVLQDRREQLEMLMAWHQDLQSLEVDTTQAVVDFWHELAPDLVLTEAGVAEVRRLIDKFGVSEVCESMRIAAKQYLRFESDGRCIAESWCMAFDKVGGICFNRKREQTDPDAAHASRVVGYLRHRMEQVARPLGRTLVLRAIQVGIEPQEIKGMASRVNHSWSAFRDVLTEWIDDAEPEAVEEGSGT